MGFIFRLLFTSALTCALAAPANAAPEASNAAPATAKTAPAAEDGPANLELIGSGLKLGLPGGPALKKRLESLGYRCLEFSRRPAGGGFIEGLGGRQGGYNCFAPQAPARAFLPECESLSPADKAALAAATRQALVLLDEGGRVKYISQAERLKEGPPFEAPFRALTKKYGGLSLFFDRAGRRPAPDKLPAHVKTCAPKRAQGSPLLGLGPEGDEGPGRHAEYSQDGQEPCGVAFSADLRTVKEGDGTKRVNFYALTLLDGEALAKDSQALRAAAAPAASKGGAAASEGAGRAAGRAGGETNAFGMEFVLIPAGSDYRQWVERNIFNEDVKLQRKVLISRPYYLGKYPVTQEQWTAVMGDNPSRFKGAKKRPVESVSWEMIQEFIRRLNAEEETQKYRLPTEAEWTRALLAGHWYYNGVNKADDYAWFRGDAGGTTQPAGLKKPAPNGLYDMAGNVWEFVQDWFAEDDYFNKTGPGRDPAGPAAGTKRIARGGAYDSPLEQLGGRTGVENPKSVSSNLGFRLAVSVEP